MSTVFTLTIKHLMDGVNEMFTIDNIDDTICYPENTVEIYNRWEF
jgi:hypothetical protein